MVARSRGVEFIQADVRLLPSGDPHSENTRDTYRALADLCEAMEVELTQYTELLESEGRRIVKRMPW